jgi:hypothetical protein
MKTLIEVNKETWAQVKYFATTKEFSLNKAVEVLLIKALREAINR